MQLATLSQQGSYGWIFFALRQNGVARVRVCLGWCRGVGCGVWVGLLVMLDFVCDASTVHPTSCMPRAVYVVPYAVYV